MCRRGAGGEGCTPSSPARTLAARAFTVAGGAAAPDGNTAPPGPAGGPHSIGAASSRPKTLHRFELQPTRWESPPSAFPRGQTQCPPTSPRAVPEAEGFQIPGGRWGRFLFLSSSLNLLLLLPTPVLPPSLSEELHICVTLGKLLNVSVAQSVH